MRLSVLEMTITWINMSNVLTIACVTTRLYICVAVEHLFFVNIKRIFILFLLSDIIQVSPASILCFKTFLFRIAFEII